MKRIAPRLACSLALVLALAAGGSAAEAATSHSRLHHGHAHHERLHRQKASHKRAAAKEAAKAAAKHPKQVCKVSVLKTHTSVGIELRRIKHCFTGEK